MKVRYVVLVVVGATLLGVAATVGLVFVGGELDLGILLLACLSALTLFLVPALVVSTLSNWTFDTTGSDGKGILQRAGIFVGAVQTLAVAGSIAAGALQPDLAPFLIFLVSVAVTLTIVSVYFGWRLRVRNLATPTGEKPWQIILGAEVARKVGTIVVTFFAAVVISVGLGVTLFAVVAAVVGETVQADSIGALAGFACSVGLISAGGAAGIVSFTYSQRLQPALGNDIAFARRVRRIVVRGKDEPLADDERGRAVGWASIMAVYLPFQVAASTLGSAGLLLIQVINLTNLDDLGLRDLFVVVIAVIAASTVVTTVLLLYQARRVRIFAADHLDMLVPDERPT